MGKREYGRILAKHNARINHYFYPSMKLIIGLGNPGKKYEITRHNIGFLVADTLQKTFSFPPFQNKDRFQSLLTEDFIGLHRVLLVKPQTYMNLSGEAISSILSFYKIPLKDLLVVHDDIDLSWGTLKHTSDSRSAGHRGVQNSIDRLGTQKFSRLRVGVGPRPENISTENFVLTPFTREEIATLPNLLAEAVRRIPDAIE